MRKMQTMRGEPPRYDGTYRNYPADEAQKRIDNGEPHTWRFKIDQSREEIVFDDMVQGTKRFQAEHIGDFVLVRADGSATYPFAVVIDDHAMGMTHIVRGVDHLANTARQIPVFEALGYPVPLFAHLPLVLAPGSDQALSKRNGASSLRQLREEGYLPEAVRNTLAMLGWAAPEGEEMLPGHKLIDAFELESVRTGHGHFNPELMLALNARYLRESPIEEVLPMLLDFAGEGFSPELGRSHPTLSAEEWLREAALLFRENANTLAELVTQIEEFAAYSPEAHELPLPARQAMAEAWLALETWEIDAITPVIKATGKEHGLKGKKLFMPLRHALTGKDGGPHINALVHLLGPRETARRLNDPA